MAAANQRSIFKEGIEERGFLASLRRALKRAEHMFPRDRQHISRRNFWRHTLQNMSCDRGVGNHFFSGGFHPIDLKNGKTTGENYW